MQEVETKTGMSCWDYSIARIGIDHVPFLRREKAFKVEKFSWDLLKVGSIVVYIFKPEKKVIHEGKIDKEGRIYSITVGTEYHATVIEKVTKKYVVISDVTPRKPSGSSVFYPSIRLREFLKEKFMEKQDIMWVLNAKG